MRGGLQGARIGRDEEFPGVPVTNTSRLVNVPQGGDAKGLGLWLVVGQQRNWVQGALDIIISQSILILSLPGHHHSQSKGER